MNAKWHWIALDFKKINGPTLYFAAVSALVMIVSQGLGVHFDTTTVLGFFAIVASFIWNNGKLKPPKAIHTANFWITLGSALLLLLTQGFGLHLNTTALQAAIVLVVGIIFHNGNASWWQALEEDVATGKLGTVLQGLDPSIAQTLPEVKATDSAKEDAQ